jgi:hypothetical protein
LCGFLTSIPGNPGDVNLSCFVPAICPIIYIALFRLSS